MIKPYWKYAIFVAPAVLKDGELIQTGLGHIEVYRGFSSNINGNKDNLQPTIKSNGFVEDYVDEDFYEKWYPDEFHEAFGVLLMPYETYRLEYEPSVPKGLTDQPILSIISARQVETIFEKGINYNPIKEK